MLIFQGQVERWDIHMGPYVNARRESKSLRQITGNKTVHMVFKQFLEVLLINVIKLLEKTVIM